MCRVIFLLATNVVLLPPFASDDTPRFTLRQYSIVCITFSSWTFYICLCFHLNQYFCFHWFCLHNAVLYILYTFYLFNSSIVIYIVNIMCVCYLMNFCIFFIYFSNLIDFLFNSLIWSINFVLPRSLIFCNFSYSRR